jgi:nicotinamide-nucleotide amidase
MTGANPTIGLSAHAGQTDIRITAKADSEEEATRLIKPLEEELRQTLGVAIYGEDDQSVPEVVGRLLERSGHTVGIMDTVTDGRLVQELQQAGYGSAVGQDLHLASLDEVAESAHVSSQEEGKQTALALAARLAEESGIGLVLLGPFAKETVYVAVCGPEGLQVARTMRGSRREAEYRQRWMIIQGLDWLRRAVLGQLESPVDWHPSDGKTR